ncbi:MAG: hypothetical protein KDA32_11840 [Phycisphaerales bacterium]|nr:hypothetical protein [Phycisphaerales bacterium]
MSRVICVLLIGIFASSCGAQSEPKPAPPTPPAPRSSADDSPYDWPESVCELKDERIREASGIAASRANPGLFYIINDSNNDPFVFVVDKKGETRVTIRLVGAKNIDWEDISMAPGEKPDTWDVVVADIGDNNGKRSTKELYRFPEPNISDDTPKKLDIEPVLYETGLSLGPANAETFMVHPKTGCGYLVTRARPNSRVDVYKLPAPWKREGITRMFKIAEPTFLPNAAPLMQTITAGDISPDGRRLILRTYVGGLEYTLPDDDGDLDFDKIFTTRPRMISLAMEPQGEAVCYTPDGKALWTVSEKVPTYLFEAKRLEKAPAGIGAANSPRANEDE